MLDDTTEIEGNGVPIKIEVTDDGKISAGSDYWSFGLDTKRLLDAAEGGDSRNRRWKGYREGNHEIREYQLRSGSIGTCR